MKELRNKSFFAKTLDKAEKMVSTFFGTEEVITQLFLQIIFNLPNNMKSTILEHNILKVFELLKYIIGKVLLLTSCTLLF